MRAIRIDQFGGPEVLKLAEVMFPRPENGQVVISVDAAGVNLPTRMTFITATFSPVELPFVPGREGARRLPHRRPSGPATRQPSAVADLS